MKKFKVGASLYWQRKVTQIESGAREGGGGECAFFFFTLHTRMGPSKGSAVMAEFGLKKKSR